MQATKLPLDQVDGVMMGREVYHNPYILSEVDQQLFRSSDPVLTRLQVIESLIPYIEKEQREGVRLHSITRHILGLFNGLPGAKKWRRYISENAPPKEAGIDVLKDSLVCLRLSL